MNHKEVIAAVASKMNMPVGDIEAYLNSTVDVMKERILEGKGVALHGFGNFDLKRREERLSVHPATGVRTIIPPKQVVAFKQGNQLKSKLKDLKYNG